MKKKRVKTIIVAIVIIGMLLTALSSVFAQTNAEQERTELERQLAELEAKIVAQQRDVTITKAERERLQYEVNNIKKRISQLNAQIKEAEATVRALTGQIQETQDSINTTIAKIEDLRWKLGGNLRTIYEEDKKSPVEVFLSEDNISDFFDSLLGLEILSSQTRDLLGEITTLKVNLEIEKENLDGKRTETEQMARIQALQAEETRRIQAAQEALLRDVQNKEANQEQELETLKQQAAKIRARIFELAATPMSEAPTFGEAYEIALWVESVTGVRPAFLLSILQQESAIGKNVGQCYLSPDPEENLRNRGMATPPSSKRNDVANFLIITKELGLDPYKTPISCPMSFGWGGAMGPAQFIPTTWMNYRLRLQLILGRPASPWNIRDAFLASGLYLSDYGANTQTKEGEWKAAMIYFSGSTTNPAYYFYADQVLKRADSFQRDIDVLKQSK